MLRFQYSSLIDAEPEVVWQFYERAELFDLLTPPWQPVKVIRREGGLSIGAITEFRLLLSIFPIRWIAEHIECKPNQLFVDTQVIGPMKSWLHRHQFIQEESKTRLIDTIEYELPGGWLAEFLLGWWVNARLQEMFRYRHQVTQRECPGKND
ncbi:cyclase/dehydrase [Stanieria cyanosphaera PCC 7437]|uniref:Cyclase/dehydrase n=1 Tax=Stanieria cyanosphaera (strain ATCC 29371 / PCC 7437) TaxID=111780 RepID=K9XTG3_STAC7|nr:SRPBCC family protein [Stanieria cyanosphaera]AFZ34957.1 cyclase/dehydrase [Stanieria cyanosphaera PCC 7437]